MEKELILARDKISNFDAKNAEQKKLYEEEVALRMKFEAKVNHLHAIH